MPWQIVNLKTQDALFILLIAFLELSPIASIDVLLALA